MPFTVNYTRTHYNNMATLYSNRTATPKLHNFNGWIRKAPLTNNVCATDINCVASVTDDAAYH